jgi:hypothetical protein
MNWAGKHMASSKMKKKNKIASDDAERAELASGAGEQIASSNDRPSLTLYEIQLAFNHGKKIPVMQVLAADPLHRDALLREREPIEELLKRLSQSPREDRDLLSLSEALDFIQYFLIKYRSPGNPDNDETFRQFDEEAHKELDTFYKKTVEMIFNIYHSYLLADDSPLCSSGVALAQRFRSDRANSPDSAAWAHPAVEKLLELQFPTIAEGTIIALGKFAKLVAAKREGLKKKTGPKTPRAAKREKLKDEHGFNPPRKFVEAIIQTIEEYTGSKVKRRGRDKGVAAGSPLDVVHKIVAMMDPDIKNGTIEEALKSRSKARGEIKRPKWW